MRLVGIVAAIGGVIALLLLAPWPSSGGDSRATDPPDEAVAAGGLRAATPTSTAIPPTPTPLPPTPTPTPDPIAWAVLTDALDRRDWTEATQVYDRNATEIDARGRDTFVGLSHAFADEYPTRLRHVDQLIVERDFTGSMHELDRLLQWYPERPQLVDRHEAATEWSTQLDFSEPWTESIPHLFIHSLIVDYDKVFDGDYTDAGYREFMITRLEFTRALEQLHDNDFILIDVHDLYRETDDGLEPTPLIVPAGKRPLVFSIDDVSYYSYMATDGFPDRLAIDRDLNVATVMIRDDGTETLTLDGDAMPILDRFVWDNPDFSLGGAKGIIALTGYEGVFGYDISEDQSDKPDFADRVEHATVVAERLRELGWDFASHSYTHDNALQSPTVSYGRFVHDSDRWNRDINPVLGGVDLYISPFGFDLRDNNPRLRYLIDDMGFNAFMPISSDTEMTWGDGYLRMYRTALDGFMLLQAPQLLAPYLDADTVLDEARFEGP